MDQTLLTHPFEDSALPPAVGAIVRAGLWCVVETRTAAAWEPRLMICRDDEDGVAEAIAEWRRECPEADAQIAGYTRDTLRRSNSVPAVAFDPPLFRDAVFTAGLDS